MQNDYHKREGEYYLVDFEETQFVWVDEKDRHVSPAFEDMEDAEFWMMTDGQIMLFGYTPTNNQNGS